tara:strand:- start:901 stop:1761 length:861 start_codon:yes stop_codon:yes gene_type:complete
MSLHLSKINDIAIEPVIDNSKINPKKIVGYDWFPEPYANVALVARKMSGKTTVIYRALEKCAVKGCNIMIFASTVNNDSTYKKMVSMLKKKGCNVTTDTHFIDERGIDQIKLFLDILSKGDETEVTGHDEIPKSFVDRGQFDHLMKPVEGEKKKKKKQKKKSTKIVPDTILVFDDMSSCMRSPIISRLLTKNRHYKLKIFIACHSIVNLDRQGLRMIDYFMVFPNINEEKMEELADKVGISFKGDTKKHKILWDIYSDATKDPYNFLYIDRVKCQYRKNFNEIYEI